MTTLCKTVRKSCIPICDSFNFSDFIINSPLGRYDGNMYESYFGLVSSSYKPAVIPPYFKDEIYPLLNRSRDEDDELEIEDESLEDE